MTGDRTGDDGLQRLADPTGPGRSGEVWRLDLDRLRVAPSVDATFEEFERERLSRLRFARDACRYRAAHWGLRLLLARPLGLAPAQVRLRSDAQGKPRLAHDGDWHFSLSHSGGIGVVAWCQGWELGVDVECRRPLPDVDALAASLLSADEARAWRRLGKDARAEAFLVAWTRKEAAAKALGTGLAIEPRQIEAGLSAGPSRWKPAAPWGEVQLAATRLGADSVVSLAWQRRPA